MTKKCNSQSGFAIGTILLAVVLIAAIVSAIAIASRGTQTQGNREQTRVNASTVISQGINLSNAFQRLIGTGATTDTISATSADAGTAPATNGGSNAAATADCTVDAAHGATNFQCLYGAGAGTVQQVPRQALASGTTAPVGGRYFYNRNAAGVVGTAISSPGIIYVGGLDSLVCSQINNLVNNSSINTAPPVVTTSQSANLSSATTGENTALDFTSTPVISTWREGCINTATAGAPVYTYFRAL
ncbi:MAG: hypothetical protein AB7G80_06305 [Dongiaceae bacterium]